MFPSLQPGFLTEHTVSAISISVANNQPLSTLCFCFSFPFHLSFSRFARFRSQTPAFLFFFFFWFSVSDFRIVSNTFFFCFNVGKWFSFPYVSFDLWRTFVYVMRQSRFSVFFFWFWIPVWSVWLLRNLWKEQRVIPVPNSLIVTHFQNPSPGWAVCR